MRKIVVIALALVMVWNVNAYGKVHTNHTVRYTASRGSYEYERDVKLLSHLLFCECGHEPYSGQMGVANVILNRYESGKYGDTLKKVIMNPSQFNGVSTPDFYKDPTEDNVKAAYAVLSGHRVFNSSVLYYYNPDIATNKSFISSIKPVMTIGHHVFAIDKVKKKIKKVKRG